MYMQIKSNSKGLFGEESGNGFRISKCKFGILSDIVTNLTESFGKKVCFELFYDIENHKLKLVPTDCKSKTAYSFVKSRCFSYDCWAKKPIEFIAENESLDLTNYNRYVAPVTVDKCFIVVDLSRLVLDKACARSK